MKTLHLVLFLAGVFCAAGCLDLNPEKDAGNPQRSPETIAAVRFSDTYKAAEFTDPERLQKIKDLLPEAEKIFRDYAEKNHYPGYTYGIVVDGELIFSGGVGVINLERQQPAVPGSLFRIASMTKSFTAMAIVKLRDEGKLSLTDPAANYLPDLAHLVYPAQDATPLTIHNLLTMTAGFPEDNPWGDRQLEDTEAEFLEFLRGGISFSTVPSSGFEYSNLGYAMLGQIITQVSGIPYQQYISEQIFQPLGMTDTHWEYEGLPAEKLALGYRWEDEQWKLEPMLHDGAYGAMGGLITSIDDFSKYLAFHLAAWPPRNGAETGPVKRSSVREMQRIYEPRLAADAKDKDGAPCPLLSGYGFGLGIVKDCKGRMRVAHSGGLPGFGSNHVFLPDYGIGVLSFANRTYSPAGAANVEVLNMLVEKAGLKPRELPVSDILAQRKEQVVQLIQTWDENPDGDFLAENFYLDFSRERRKKETEELMQPLGKITSVGPLIPQNQLRGAFTLHCEKGDLEVFFTLSPEREPKVQALEVTARLR